MTDSNLLHGEVTTSIAEGIDFPGCTDANPNLCACENWAPPVCDRCEQDIENGQRVHELTRIAYPYLPVDDRDQEWEHFIWHDQCRGNGSADA